MHDIAPRRQTISVDVGGARIGGDAPIAVQSMTNTDTADIEKTARQIAELARAGSELVRITVDRDIRFDPTQERGPEFFDTALRHSRNVRRLKILLPTLAGIGVPTLTRALSRGLGRRLVAVRSELNVALVDGVQGVAELLAFGADERQEARVSALSRESAALQGRMARIGGLGGSLTGLLMNRPH